jgi:bis(5'-adenosyl)-triphosphatase
MGRRPSSHDQGGELRKHKMSSKSQQNVGACPFCEASRDSNTFMRTDRFLAIYNIAPILPGHTLIIPRQHVQSVFELTASEISEFASFARDVTKLLLETYSTSAFDWSLQEKEEAGQTIPHLHLHIIPRKRSDLANPDSWYVKLREFEADILDRSSRRRLTKEELAREIERIRLTAQRIRSPSAGT